MRITVRESVSTRDANALHNHKNFKNHQKHSQSNLWAIVKRENCARQVRLKIPAISGWKSTEQGQRLKSKISPAIPNHSSGGETMCAGVLHIACWQ